MRALLDGGERGAGHHQVLAATAAGMVPRAHCLVVVPHPARPRSVSAVAGYGNWAEALVGSRWEAGKALRRVLRGESADLAGDDLRSAFPRAQPTLDACHAVPIGGASSSSPALGALCFGTAGEALSAAERDRAGLLAKIASVVMARDNYITAENANRARSRFLNLAAHELRTPLTVVAGYLSLLAEGAYGEPSPAWVRPLDLAAAKTAEMGEIVEDILLAARIEGGDLLENRRKIDLGRTVLESVDRARPRAKVLDAVLTTRIPPQPVWFTGDGYLIGRILDILLSNALNYGGTRPQVEVGLDEQPGPAITVEDSGRGIPAELQERIFEPFFRYEDPAAGLIPGTGLGLHLARQLATRHRGRLLLERSRPGGGSLFALRLP